jgi:hypothetical protein
VPWLRRSVTSLLAHRSGINPRTVYIGFVVDIVTLGQAFLPVLRLSPGTIIPTMLILFFTYIPPTMYKLSNLANSTFSTRKHEHATASLQFPTDRLYLRQIYCTLSVAEVTATRLKATQPLAPSHLEERGTVTLRKVSAASTVPL